ncbi:MAG: DUF72 domain-containing protein [Acidimicrobiales bacterium]
MANSRQPGRAWVGCSGWVYRDWRGVVYPASLPQRQWFAHYATQFATVEINNTFYRLPASATVDAWAAQAPEGFVYAVKVGGFGSHRMKLRDAESWLPRHLERVQRLGAALGPNLLQLPPRWGRNVGRLEEFLAAAPRTLRWAVELRDDSWLCDEVYDLLRRYNAALCMHDLLAAQPWELTADFAYVRFHGPDAKRRPYWGRYGGRRLRPVADRLAEWLQRGVDVYAYFNNDHEGAPVLDARWLADRLGKAGSAALGSSRGPTPGSPE